LDPLGLSSAGDVNRKSGGLSQISTSPRSATGTNVSASPTAPAKSLDDGSTNASVTDSPAAFI